MTTKPAPRPNADSAPFWQACNDERLTYQQCRVCGNVQFYPRALCTGCQSHDLDWKQSSGLGTVYTYTVNQRPPTPAFQTDGGYVIALVDLDEGYRMMMNVIDCPHEDVHIGMRVRVVYEARGEDGEQKIPQATPA
jgi:hypothetical protein